MYIYLFVYIYIHTYVYIYIYIYICISDYWAGSAEEGTWAEQTQCWFAWRWVCRGAPLASFHDPGVCPLLDKRTCARRGHRAAHGQIGQRGAAHDQIGQWRCTSNMLESAICFVTGVHTHHNVKTYYSIWVHTYASRDTSSSRIAAYDICIGYTQEHMVYEPNRCHPLAKCSHWRCPAPSVIPVDLNCCPTVNLLAGVRIIMQWKSVYIEHLHFLFICNTTITIQRYLPR